MTKYAYKPEGVCSRKISFGIEDGKVHNVEFEGGCPGNLQAIGKLLEGKDAAEIAAIITHAAMYVGWPKGWAVFRQAKEIWNEEEPVSVEKE